jgi:hypothetical protein
MPQQFKPRDEILIEHRVWGFRGSALRGPSPRYLFLSEHNAAFNTGQTKSV